MYRFAILATLLAACNDRPVVVGDLQEVTSLKAIPNRNLDILFVIDDSESMADKQAALAANFPKMMDVLGELDGGLPNLHIGVITSDMGTSGSNGAQPAPTIGQIGQGGCTGVGDAGTLRSLSPAVTGNFIVDVDDGTGGRTRNYTGDLRDAFAQNAQVGEVGCGFEQHLAAMRAALTNPANTDFFRPDANLAVIVIADEDDCSVIDPAFFGPDDGTLGPLESYRCTRAGVQCTPDMDSVGDKHDCGPRTDSHYIEDVQPFVDALLAAKPDPRYLMVAGVVGDPGPVSVELRNTNGDNELALAHTCSFFDPVNDIMAVADPGVRLAHFLDAFPERSTLTSICSADLSSPLGTIGESAKRLVGDPCVDSSRLADASADPGIQPACEVLDIRDSQPNAPTTLPVCAGGGTDCYEFVADPVACPATGDHLRIKFRRSATPFDDTWTSVRCQLRS